MPPILKHFWLPTNRSGLLSMLSSPAYTVVTSSRSTASVAMAVCVCFLCYLLSKVYMCIILHTSFCRLNRCWLETSLILSSLCYAHREVRQHGFSSGSSQSV